MRTISEIAAEISKDWKATAKNGIYFGAKPYLEAMFSLTDAKSNYGMDSAKSIVLYFLSNATTYRGAKAKELKAELKKLVGVK
jgi:hypothetical protein